MEPVPAALPFVLGIDLGTNSVGWAMVGLNHDGPASVVRCGSRVFDAGMDGDIQSGNEESRNKKRRDMRMQRRQTARRARRHRKLCRLLQSYGLLPDGTSATPEALQDTLNQLDEAIARSSWFSEKRESGAFKEPDQLLPYILRAAALDEELPPFYLGRALYHLAQRRGFKSNRKAPPKQDEKPGEVAKAIDELREAVKQSGARTLGEYFARLDPFEHRIRQRWTARDLYQDEFNRIWDTQSAYHPELLTPEHRKELFNAVFYQRPLWFPESLVGKCELEPGEPRAPKYSFLAQRFRLLQSVNNLRLEIPGEAGRPLSPEERSSLAEELELKGDRTWPQVRNLLKAPKNARFSIEKGGEKVLRGNRTTSFFYKIFGERWLEMSAEEHEKALHDAISIQSENASKKRAMSHWGLSEEAADSFAKFAPEPDYFNYSLTAMKKLLPLLEAGKTYAEARRELYPEKFSSRGTLSELPPLFAAADEAQLDLWAAAPGRIESEKLHPEPVGEIRNPAVTRSLTEMRKVVNAIIRQYGKPVEVRIELARDLKRSKKDRQKLTSTIRENELSRDKAKDRILKEAGIPHPRRDDIRKALLWDECGGICPYTGRPIAFASLFGDSPQFDIEHIIPFERSFDNSFPNLTLCEVHENRHVKGGQTPWEAYGNTERWDQILDRVKRFPRSAASKLWRFQLKEKEAAEFISKFVSRQLNDTRYASRLAAKYVAMLYGGLSDDEHTRRVHVTSGEVTAQLRRAWNLNGILNDGGTQSGGEIRKTRDDHRHHAVDAVAIALTSNSTIQQLSRAAETARQSGHRKLSSIRSPWPDFADSMRKQIDEVVVSHRVSKKVSGALHEETIYSPPFKRNGANGKTAEAVRVRKPLPAITKPELECIVDDAVRKLVREKLESLGGGDPKKVFKDEANLPCFVTADGPRISIKKVRIEKRTPVRPLGEGRGARHVTSESNHHVEIYAEIKPDGSEGRWDGEVVSMMEACQRKRAGKPIVQRDHGPLVQFKFSLAPGEVIECDDRNGGRTLWVVRGAGVHSAGPRLSFAGLNDARQTKEMDSKEYWRPLLNPLRKLHPRKVAVNPLGNLREAHD